jgi:hypothetical protein
MGVANRIEKLQKDFLWGGVGNEFKFHLVNWAKICSSLCFGSLGVRNLTLFNRALLGKCPWHFATEMEALGRLVVKTKYDSMRGGRCSKGCWTLRGRVMAKH